MSCSSTWGQGHPTLSLTQPCVLFTTTKMSSMGCAALSPCQCSGLSAARPVPVALTASQVLAEMPHKTYGVARFGDLREEFEVWPTTITGTAIEPRIQAVHFDIVLAKDDMVPSGQRVEDMAKAQRDRIVAALRPTAASLMDLFAPRVGRYSGKDSSRQDHPRIEGREPW